MGSIKKFDIEKNKIAKRCWEEDHSFDWDQRKLLTIITKRSILDVAAVLDPTLARSKTVYPLKNLDHIYTLP